MLKKSDLIAVFGTLQKIGDVFAPVNDGKPLTRSTISYWDEEIDDYREYQLRKLIPDIDKRIAKAKRRARATA
jgi:hypothetical protein